MNPLLEQLSSPKEGVEATGSTGNPLRDQLTVEKETVEPKIIDINRSTGTENPPPPTPEPPKDPPAPERKEPEPSKIEIDWNKRAGRIMRMWDGAASRGLQFLAKDKSKDPWKLTEEDKAELLPALAEVAERRNWRFDSPELELAQSLLFIYAEKGAQAWKMREKNELIEQQQTEIERLKHELEKKRVNEQYPEPPPATKYEEAHIESETVNEAKVIPIKPTPPVENDQITEAEALLAKLQGEKQQINPVSTAPAVENTNAPPTVEVKTTPAAEPVEPPVVEKYRYLNDPKEPFTVCVEFWQDGVMDDAHNETYKPLKEDRTGREVEIRRCLHTRKLFEAFKDSKKKFIDKEAKNAYHYQQGKKAKKKGGGNE